MLQRITMGVLAVGMLTASVGCRNSCGERRGLFGLCSRDSSSSPGILSGFGGKNSGAECYASDSMPGQLMSFPASAGVPMLPAPGGPGLPNELPMPQPSDLIPGQRVPFAPPGVAPAPLDATMTSGMNGVKPK